MDSINNRELREQILIQKPNTMEEALKLATHIESPTVNCWSDEWIIGLSLCPLCHLVTLSLCYLVTLSLCHFVTLSLCHFVTLSFGHFVTFSIGHFVTMLLSHFVIWSLCHFVTLLLGHFVILSILSFLSFCHLLLARLMGIIKILRKVNIA